MYQMKLSRSANHEPVRGFWARVCETCYKSREGYNDHVGASVDHINAFTEIRRKRVERQKLEVSRLEKRLTKLTRLLVEPPEKSVSSNGSLFAPVAQLTGQNNQRKAIEQSVVTWEDDESISKCPFCQQEFGSWTFRRHHCRICGRVVCADTQTGCSSEVSLNVVSRKYPPQSKQPVQILTHNSIRQINRETDRKWRTGQGRRANVQGLQPHDICRSRLHGLAAGEASRSTRLRNFAPV